MVRMKNKTGKLPSEGFLKNEVIDKLRREGLYSTSGQLIKYEPNLMQPGKDGTNSYRIYTPEDVDRIREILRLRLIGLSLRKIKEYLDLKEYIFKNPMLNRLEVGKDPDTGELTYIKVMPPPSGKHDIEYGRFYEKVKQYRSLCAEIMEKSERVLKNIQHARRVITEAEEKLDKEILSHQS